MAATHDPNNIAGLLAHQPYHIGTLLQMAEIYEQVQTSFS